jgi:hypothetical protein
MPEDGQNNSDIWITVTGNGKTKNLLNPKPNSKEHNAFAILFQPVAPTHYDVLSQTQQIDDDKTIIPQAHKSTAGSNQIAQHQHIK